MCEKRNRTWGANNALMPSGLQQLDFFPKSVEEVKERTLGGGFISLCCCLLALNLFLSELTQFRAVHTVDRLEVDTSRAATDERILLNLDIYLPNLPCPEVVAEVQDQSGMQQLEVASALHKLRVDRHGVPIDVPRAVLWNETVAPAFAQRKLVGLMEEARAHLDETLHHFEHEEEENPRLSADEHAAHRRELAEQSALLQGRLQTLVRAAAAGEGGGEGGGAGGADAFEGGQEEVRRMHESVQASALVSRVAVAEEQEVMGRS